MPSRGTTEIVRDVAYFRKGRSKLVNKCRRNILWLQISENDSDDGDK